VKTLTTYLVALATVIVAAPIGQAANPTPAELQALEIRGQALNKLCSVPGRSAEAQQALCGSTRVTRPTAAELRALEIRGQAMNKLCSVPGRSAEAEQALCGSVATAKRPTAAELRALEIRGQALGNMCSDPTLTADAHRALCGKVGTANRPTAEELRALEIRGQALNGLCDTLSGEGYEAVCGRSDTVAIGRSANASGGIDWADFGIGAGAMLGLVLLSGGLLAGAYFRRKIGVRPRSVS
jgi:hypothetical protein